MASSSNVSELPVVEQSKGNNRQKAAPKRKISVSAVGEVLCSPDVLEFVISMSSTKETIEAALASVNRRSEYIQQVLRNKDVKDKHVKFSTEITRGEHVCSVQSTVVVNSSSVEHAESVRNFLIEKMDSSVQFSPIACIHSLETKENKRQEAFKKAIINARSKALSIAQMVGVLLGAAYDVTEVSQEVSAAGASTEDVFMPNSCGDDPKTTDMDKASLYHRVKAASLNYTSQVSVTFEVFPLRVCQHKKCIKHF